MANTKIKYQLIVKVPAGVVIVDSPRPRSKGAIQRRTAAIGTSLYAYNIISPEGVEYALLVPRDPMKPEWVRVREADNSIEYVDVIPLEPEGENDNSLAAAVNRLADAVFELARTRKS